MIHLFTIVRLGALKTRLVATLHTKSGDMLRSKGTDIPLIAWIESGVVDVTLKGLPDVKVLPLHISVRLESDGGKVFCPSRGG